MLECVLDEDDWHQSSLDFDVKQDVGKLGNFVQKKGREEALKALLSYQ